MPFDLKEYARKIRVTDGAWGTQLHKKGLTPGAAPELWNVTNAAAVRAVAESYVRAGSEVIITNTLGANRLMLAGHGLSTRAAELAEAGVRVSRAAAEGKDVKVFASLGPSGKIVMTEEVRPEEFLTAFAEAAEAMAFGGADAILVESFSELDEARLAVRGIRQVTDLPVVVSMTFASGPEGTSTMMGNSPADLARMVLKEGADAVGANCGVGPDNYVKVAALLRGACKLPIWIKANAGLPTVGPDGRTTFPMGPRDFAAYVPKLVAAGANFIGGCCGTGPAHIEAVREAMAKLENKNT
jgi:5-methyltetrahydrofolate--homocysteine methyltransferase